MDFVFSTNSAVDDLTKVPEHFRGMYTEQDGKFAIADQFRGVAEAVDGLNKALTAARKDAKGKPSLAQVLQPFGVDSVEALQAKMDELNQQVTSAADGKVNWDKMKADLSAAHQRELAQRDERNTSMQRSLERHLVDREAVAAIAALKGVPELLLPHIRSQVKVILDGEDYVTRVVDASGDPRGDGKGGFMSVKDLVAEMRGSTVFGRAFESDATSGGGAKPGSMARAVGTTTNAPKSPTDKIAAGLAARGRR